MKIQVMEVGCLQNFCGPQAAAVTGSFACQLNIILPKGNT
jgi:hypothetical protein